MLAGRQYKRLDNYLVNTGRIFCIFCSCIKHWRQHSRLSSRFHICRSYQVSSIHNDRMIHWKAYVNKDVNNLSSACRSTPTEGGAKTVERIVGPNTATSFNSISNDTFTCLCSQTKAHIRNTSSFLLHCKCNHHEKTLCRKFNIQNGPN